MAEKGCTETRSGYQHNQAFYVNFFYFVWLGFFRITTKAHFKKENLIVVILTAEFFNTHTEYC